MNEDAVRLLSVQLLLLEGFQVIVGLGKGVVQSPVRSV